MSIEAPRNQIPTPDPVDLLRQTVNAFRAEAGRRWEVIQSIYEDKTGSRDEELEDASDMHQVFDVYGRQLADILDAVQVRKYRAAHPLETARLEHFEVSALVRAEQRAQSSTTE